MPFRISPKKPVAGFDTGHRRRSSHHASHQPSHHQTHVRSHPSSGHSSSQSHHQPSHRAAYSSDQSTQHSGKSHHQSSHHSSHSSDQSSHHSSHSSDQSSQHSVQPSQQPIYARPETRHATDKEFVSPAGYRVHQSTGQSPTRRTEEHHSRYDVRSEASSSQRRADRSTVVSSSQQKGGTVRAPAPTQQPQSSQPSKPKQAHWLTSPPLSPCSHKPEREGWYGWWTKAYLDSVLHSDNTHPTFVPAAVHESIAQSRRKQIWLLVTVIVISVVVLVIIAVLLMVYVRPTGECSSNDEESCKTAEEGNGCVYDGASKKISCNCEHYDFKNDDGPQPACIRHSQCLHSMNQKCHTQNSKLNSCMMRTASDYKCECNATGWSVNLDQTECGQP